LPLKRFIFGRLTVPRVNDVARRAGVSMGTVSNVLNQPGRVSDGIRGVLITPVDDTRTARLTRLAERGPPVVLLGRGTGRRGPAARSTPVRATATARSCSNRNSWFAPRLFKLGRAP
jgi:DNA-binding LacI/PurR family transcriptional regulator